MIIRLHTIVNQENPPLWDSEKKLTHRSLDFLSYPSLWAVVMGCSSMAWRNAAAGIRVGRKPWRFVGYILALYYGLKMLNEYSGLVSERRKDELRRRIAIEWLGIGKKEG